MVYEDLRVVHEDVERLEEAIAERLTEKPKHDRSRLIRDHEISNFLAQLRRQSGHALAMYGEKDGRMQEIQAISTGDTLASFLRELEEIKDFHKRYPNEPVGNTETRYKRKDRAGNVTYFAGNIDAKFTGLEAFGRQFDLTHLHEEFMNLPSVKEGRKYTYIQYLDMFDHFIPTASVIQKKDKTSDEYFSYLVSLANYLEKFMRKTRPLEDVSKVISTLDEEFEKAWEAGTVPGWEAAAPAAKDTSAKEVAQVTGEGIWCADCEKEFGNPNTYQSHLGGKKHVKAAAAREKNPGKSAKTVPNGSVAGGAKSVIAVTQIKERAVAAREFRIAKLAGAMKVQRDDTRTNSERRQGMTDRERQQEIEKLYEETDSEGEEAAETEEGEEKFYNPLKLPLAWDGKPIPFWLYKLHGLGVEFDCEICGNFTYRGRRAFDKHFIEPRHVHGLKCLGIDKQFGLFREITKIAEAEKLWVKLQHDAEVELEKKGGEEGQDIVEMEDSQGNVMPWKVYHDLEKMGLV